MKNGIIITCCTILMTIAKECNNTEIGNGVYLYGESVGSLTHFPYIFAAIDNIYYISIADEILMSMFAIIQLRVGYFNAIKKDLLRLNIKEDSVHRVSQLYFHRLLMSGKLQIYFPGWQIGHLLMNPIAWKVRAIKMAIMPRHAKVILKRHYLRL